MFIRASQPHGETRRSLYFHPDSIKGAYFLHGGLYLEDQHSPVDILLTKPEALHFLQHHCGHTALEAETVYNHNKAATED